MRLRRRVIGRFSFCLAFIVAATLGLAAGMPVAADDHRSEAWRASQPSLPPQATPVDGTTCWSLDLMLLIDQSRSMFAGSGSQTPSDPDGYRYLAAEDVLDRLVFSRLDQCPEAVHRFGLVTLGNRVETILPLVPLDLAEGDDPQLWTEPLRARIAEAAQDTTQQGTDFLLAFNAAEALFEEAGPIDGAGPDAQRRRVVVLLTDGSPAGIRGSVPSYMCDLQDYLNGPSWEEHSIWVVALNASEAYLDNPGCDETIRRNWEEIAEGHRGRLLALPYNEQLIPAFLNDIVDAEFGRPGGRLLCGEVFYVDPYLQRATFTFYRRGQDLSISLVRLDEAAGPLYRVTGPGKEEVLRPEEVPRTDFREDLYESSPYKEQFVLDLPSPGPWQFYVEDLGMEECQRRIEGRITPEVADVQLLEPAQVVVHVADPPYYDDTQEPVHFAVALQTDRGALVPPEADYPLAVAVEWRLPSGAETLPDGTLIQAATFQPGPEEWWISVEPVLGPEVGVYPLTIVGTAPRGDRSTEYTVFTRTAAYEARKFERLAFAVEAPQADQNLPCNELIGCAPVALPLPVRVLLHDEAAQPVDGSGCIADIDQAFEAIWIAADGSVIDTTTLAASAEEPGVFEGVLQAEESGSSGCGETNVAISFVGSHDAERCTMPDLRLVVPLTRPSLRVVRVEPLSPQDGARVPLHRDFGCACRDEVQPVSLVFALTDCDGVVIDPAEIVSGTSASFYEVRLVGPTGLRSGTLAVERVELDEGPALQATNGSAVLEAGSYTFEILLGDDLPVGYVPAQETVPPIEFELKDALWTNPTACRALKWGTLGIILVAACILLYLTTGPLYGTVMVFTTRRGYGYVEQNSVGGGDPQED